MFDHRNHVNRNGKQYYVKSNSIGLEKNPCKLNPIHFTFQLTIQLALCGFAEFVLHLTRMNPDMMYLHQDSGFLNIAYYKFDIDDTTGGQQFKINIRI